MSEPIPQSALANADVIIIKNVEIIALVISVDARQNIHFVRLRMSSARVALRVSLSA
jgi:hypothetical protein